MSLAFVFGMISVQELRDVTRPTQLRHVWQALWDRTPHASFRQTAEFLDNLTTPGGERLRVFQVSAWDRPIGLVPLHEYRARRLLREQTVLSFPESPWGGFPGPVGPHSATTMAALIRHLVDHDHSWDLLEFPEVVTDAQTPQRMARSLQVSGRQAYFQTRHTLHGIELPLSWSHFWNERNAQARGLWRTAEFGLARLSKVQFVRFRPDGSRVGDTNRDWSFLRHLDAVVQQQADGGLKTAAYQMLGRLCELHPHTVDAGCADVAVLFVDSQPVACAYNFHHDQRVETLQLLADPRRPQAADWLIGQMLRDEIHRGDRWHTFLPSGTVGTAIDWRMWQCNELHETVVSHDRHAPIGNRMLRWLSGSRPIPREGVDFR